MKLFISSNLGSFVGHEWLIRRIDVSFNVLFFYLYTIKSSEKESSSVIFTVSNCKAYFAHS